MSASEEYLSTEGNDTTRSSMKKFSTEKESPASVSIKKKSDKNGAVKKTQTKKIPMRGVESAGLRQATGLPSHSRSTSKVIDSPAVV